MPLNKIHFRKDGPPVTVEIQFGYAQVGAYNLILWDATGSGKRKLGEGINTDLIPDIYTLPQPNSENDKRILDCLATIIAPDPKPGERYRVDMIVRQDSKLCGQEYDEGVIDKKSITTRLAVELIGD